MSYVKGSFGTDIKPLILYHVIKEIKGRSIHYCSGCLSYAIVLRPGADSLKRIEREARY